jgi:hypothetical protein
MMTCDDGIVDFVLCHVCVAFVLQVWEEDMQDFDDLWNGGPFTAAADAADDSDDDSNAEGYYANSYPDEADSYQADDDGDDGVIEYEHDEDDGDEDYGGYNRGYGGGGYAPADSDSSAEEGRYSGGVYAAVHGKTGAVSVDAGGVITRYEQRSRRSGRWQGVADDVDAEEQEEFDVDDYVSSGEEEAAGQRQTGPYGAQVLSGGAAWRAMLAQEFGPVAHGADAADA